MAHIYTYICMWWMVTAALKLKDDCSLDESYDKPREHIKKQKPLYQQRSV